MSLQLRAWWERHQEADRKRLQREMERAERDHQKAAALAKLTPHERKLLGVDENR